MVVFCNTTVSNHTILVTNHHKTGLGKEEQESVFYMLTFMKTSFVQSKKPNISWRSHQMGTFSSLLALCEGNSPVTGGFPSQMPLTQSFDILFDLRLYKRLSKLEKRRWFETPSRSLGRHSNVFVYQLYVGFCQLWSLMAFICILNVNLKRCVFVDM